jgi:CBS domain-containing protein
MTSSDLPDELRVRAWMNPPEHTIEANAYAEDAFAAMKRAGIRHLLVMKDDDLVGVVTDRDLRRPDFASGDVMSVRELYRLGDELRVYDVMTSDPVTASADDHASQAARVMVENKFNCLPVVDDDRLVGIITSSDLLAALVHSTDPDFAEIRDAG